MAQRENDSNNMLLKFLFLCFVWLRDAVVVSPFHLRVKNNYTISCHAIDIHSVGEFDDF